MQTEDLREIFAQIDKNGDGIIDFKEYSAALEVNPDLLDWFKLLNKKLITEEEQEIETQRLKKRFAEEEQRLKERKDRLIRKVTI